MPTTIALIAHDNKKEELVDWARRHIKTLKAFHLCATGTTGSLISKRLGLNIKIFKSGPLGGDQQISAEIVNGKVDMVVFFWDPLSPHSHDVDVKALLRIAVVYDIPMACSSSSADMMFLGNPLHQLSKKRKFRLPRNPSKLISKIGKE